MIRSLSIFVLFCCILGYASRVNAQTGDSSITYSVIKLEPCRYRLFVSNTSPDCYNGATLLLQAGYYTGFTANGADGWVVEQLGQTELLLTHINGLFPVGSTRAVDFTFFEPGGTDPVFSVLYPNLCLMQSYAADFLLEACPGGCVSGTVYRECKSLPYTNQIPLEGWTVQLVDALGNPVGSVVSDANGAYSICDLAPGQYAVKTEALAGWKASLPPSGQWTVQVAAAGNYTRDFGYCPPCSCDSLDVLIAQEPGLTDTNDYYVVLNYDPYCFLDYTLTIENGDLVDFTALDTIVTVEKTGPNTLMLRVRKPPPYYSHIKLEPCKYRIAGPGSQNTLISASHDIGAGPVTCTRKFEYPPSSPQSCCPPGTAPGPELVANGDFESGNTNFTSGHSYVPPPGAMISGQYTVAQSNQISTINSQWACTDHTNGSATGKMLVVDGSKIPPGITKVWKQNVPVVAGKTYAFSAWMNNLVVPFANYKNPIVALFIDGKPLTGILLSETPDQWRRRCRLWKAPVTGTATLEVRIARFDILGNDFAVDDISFRACEPVPCQADFAINFIDQCGHVQLVNTSTGGVSPYAPLWSNGSNSQTLDLQLPCGNYTYCLTITDAANCTATICKSFTVSDITPPKAVCVPGFGVDLDASCEAQLTPGMIDGGSTDNCQIKTLQISPDVLTGCSTHNVTLTVTDWCGNTSTCTADVQTLEVTPPVINCPKNLIVHGVLDPLGICRTEVTGIAPVSMSDACGILGVGYTINAGSLVALPDASGTIFSQGATTVAYFAADKCLNTASCSFTVTVVCPDCVCPAPGTPGNELVDNGDFNNSGGFTSGYSNNCSGQTEGQYCITDDASKVNPGFAPCGDTTSAGNILVANGALTPNIDVLCYPISNLTQNTNYIFSFYNASVSGASPAQLAVYFDGTQVGSVAQLALATCAWRKYCVVWNSGNNTSITVCIRNLNTQAQGNDFAIDKVSFKECSECAPLSSLPVLWMPMDEIGGAGISSITGGLFAISSSGAIGSSGPMPVPGKVDATPPIFGFGALQFSGTSTNVASVSNDPTLNFGAGPFTIDAWVKDNSGTQTGPIVVKRDNQGGYSFAITGTSTKHPTLNIQTTAGVEVLQGPPIAIGQWNFVAVAVNPPNVTFYVGGDPGGGPLFTSSTHTLAGTPDASNSSALYIGYNPQ
ncbi:MAG: HYR domain-containing protein, partial [Saprospiraceae bacterium]|nr:HYR domain-containing protein [Saprospiraceae bacterium]